MTVNFDVLGAAAGPAGARLDRREAGARQDRWMQQLERAAFEAVAKPDAPRAQHGAPAGAAPAPAAPQGAAAPAKALAPAGGHARAASAAMAPAAAGARCAAAGPRAAAPAAHAGAAAGAARAAATQGAGTPAAPTQAAQPDSGAAGHNPLHALPAAHMAGAAQGELNALAALAGATPPAFAATTYALAAGAAGAVATSAASALRPGAPGAGTASLPAPAPVAAGPAPALAPAIGAGPSSAQPDEAPSQEAAEAGHGAPEQHAAGEAEQYTKSLLHVYRDNQGVHAWLRDAALDGGQVRAVAQAMAGELARSGTPLAALSINGKKIVAGPGPADESDHSEAAPDEARATLSSARHGGLPAVQGAL